MISVEHLTKCYGDFMAVDDLSFTIDEGHVYGFLGPNGAGKSTTMNIMTGCLSATQGQVKIDGYDIFEEPNEAKKRIGYLPEQPPLYMNESPREYLQFVGKAKGLRGGTLKQQIEEVIAQTGIEPVCHRRMSALSKGYRQRVGIAQALLGNPRVIVLDEPTVGLDPLQIVEIRDLIQELGQTHTVLFSSHILSEVQAICDQILIINKGKLIAFDEPDNLEHQLLSPNEISLTTDAAEAEVRRVLAGIGDVTEYTVAAAEAGYTRGTVKSEHGNIYDVSRDIYNAFVDNKLVLLELSLKKASLEDIFLELTEEKEQAAQEPAGREEPDERPEAAGQAAPAAPASGQDSVESGVKEA